MKASIRKLALCTSLGMIAGLSSGLAHAQTTKLVLANGLAPLVTLNQMFEFLLAPRLELYSGGAITTDVKGNTALCSEHKCVEQARLGQVDIVTASSENMGAFGKTFDINGLPFLFKDDAAAQKLLNGWLGEHLKAEAVKEQQLHVLGVVVSLGFRNLQNKVRPLKSPADLKGIKFRVTKSPVEFTLIKQWGGTPVPFDWAQLYEGLRTGVVEGMYIPDAYVGAQKFQEVTPYITDIGGMLVTHVVSMTKKRYDSLPPVARSAVDRVSREMLEENLGLDRMQRAKIIVEVKKQAKYYYPTDAERQQFAVLAPKAWVEMKGRYDPKVARRALEEQGQKNLIAQLEKEGAL
jgi:TRAP-type C4-dicarboxylate transport system substrate-binding protein